MIWIYCDINKLDWTESAEKLLTGVWLVPTMWDMWVRHRQVTMSQFEYVSISLSDQHLESCYISAKSYTFQIYVHATSVCYSLYCCTNLVNTVVSDDIWLEGENIFDPCRELVLSERCTCCILNIHCTTGTTYFILWTHSVVTIYIQPSSSNVSRVLYEVVTHPHPAADCEHCCFKIQSENCSNCFFTFTPTRFLNHATCSNVVL